MTRVSAQQAQPPSSGLGPLADLHLLGALIRVDGDDVASMARVLSGTLAAVLPAAMVDVGYDRSLADRLTGRPGRSISILVHGDTCDLELAQGDRGRVEGQVRRIVDGVVISRRSVGVAEWIDLLALELQHRAARDAAAKNALTRLHEP